jgi:hypothetical protein
MENFFDIPGPDQKPDPPAAAGAGAPEYKTSLGLFRAQVSEMVDRCLELKVSDADSYGQAAGLVGAVKGLMKKIDGRRKSIVKPYNDYVRKVNAFSRQFSDRLKEAENHLKREIGGYSYRQEQERRKREAELRRRQEAEQARLKAGKRY